MSRYPEPVTNPLLYAATVLFPVIIITAIVLPMLRRFLGLSDNITGKLAHGATYVVVFYVSLCLTGFWLNYSFQPAQFRASVHDTNQGLRSVWQWVRGL